MERRAAGRGRRLGRLIMNELLVYFAACVITAMAVLSVLRWRFPHWGLRRTSMLAALPVPALTLLVCAWVAIKTAMIPASKCGIDACGMAMGFALIVAVIALIGFVLTWAIGAAIMIARRKRA